MVRLQWQALQREYQEQQTRRRKQSPRRASKESKAKTTEIIEIPATFKEKLNKEILKRFSSLGKLVREKIIQKYSKGDLSSFRLKILEAEIIFEDKVRRKEIERCS